MGKQDLETHISLETPECTAGADREGMHLAVAVLHA